jgi:hypothetical protein
VHGRSQAAGSPTTTEHLASPETTKVTTATPEEPPPVPDIESTPSGLPVRVPQANLAPPLRADETLAAEQEAEAEEDQGRSPAEIQRIMGSYQRGSRRGRSDAARAADRGEGEEDQ